MNEKRVLPDDVLSPVLEPEAAVEYLWSAEEGYRRRFRGSQHSAELFIANSRLSTDTIAHVATHETIEEVREAFLEQYVDSELLPDLYRSLEEEGLEDQVLRSILSVPVTRRALFGCEVLFVSSEGTWVLRPGIECLWRTSHMTEAGTLDFEQAVDINLSECNALVLIAGPWRYMYFLGPRGLKNALADVGAVASHVQSWVSNITVEWNFCDDLLHRALLVDGIERFATAVIPLPKGS